MQIQLLREALPKGDPEPTKVVCDCSNPPTRGGDSAVPVTVNCSSESSSQGTGTGTGGSNAAREGTYDIGTTPINLVQNLYITPEKAREITEQEVRLLQWLLLLEERKVLEKDPDAECVPDEHRVQEFIAETRAALAAIQQGVASKDSRFEQGFTIATSTLASLEANLTKAPHLSMLVLGNVACLKAPLDWSWLKKGVTRLAQHAWLVLGAIWAWTAGLRATGRRFSSWAAGRRGDPGSPDYGLTRNGLTWNLTWAGLIAIGVLISIVNLSPYWRLALLLGNAQVAVNCFLLRPAKRAWKALSLERQAAQLAPLLDEIRRAADAGVAVKADLKLVTKRIDGLAAQKAGLKWGWFEAPPESKDLLHQRLMRLATVLSEQKRRAKALENSTP